MSLFRFIVVSALAGIAGSGTSDQGAPTPTTEHVAEAPPRVEIGDAVLYLYDESGRVIAVE